MFWLLHVCAQSNYCLCFFLLCFWHVCLFCPLQPWESTFFLMNPYSINPSSSRGEMDRTFLHSPSTLLLYSLVSGGQSLFFSALECDDSTALLGPAGQGLRNLIQKSNCVVVWYSNQMVTAQALSCLFIITNVMITIALSS